jgi:acyl-CoA dehydrogenase
MGLAYDDGDRARAFADQVRKFVEAAVIPAEREVLGSGPVSEATVEELREAARDRDLYAPQVGEEYGGQGMGFGEVLPAFEAAGRSLLGPAAIRVDAPDEGNMHTLEMLGTDEQKARWLRPLVAGEIRSGFAMTEPRPGAGSDPKMIRSTAERDGDEWVIDGHKWWTTNGSVADVLIVMARTDEDAHPYEGCSLLLVPADADGVEVLRDIPHVGGGVTGTVHSEIRFDGVRVPEANLLGNLNEGFAHAQQRLGPARLTHCMRFSGMAERALDVATAYTADREAFGSALAETGSVRADVADAATRLHAVRTMVRHAADCIAAGEEARLPVSMAKLYAANVTQDVIDACVQLCGASGVGKDLPLAEFYEEIRQFRIVDGPDEVHRRVVARDAFEEAEAAADELDVLPRYRG